MISSISLSICILKASLSNKHGAVLFFVLFCGSVTAQPIGAFSAVLHSGEWTNFSLFSLIAYKEKNNVSMCEGPMSLERFENRLVVISNKLINPIILGT